jgi:hypothetical protein
MLTKLRVSAASWVVDERDRQYADVGVAIDRVERGAAERERGHRHAVVEALAVRHLPARVECMTPSRSSRCAA